jgi:biopolymer transport protein ExbD
MVSKKKREPNFEINLLPVISVLAITICFLLINAVWILVGSLDLKQASGSIPQLTDRSPVLVMSIFGEKVRLQLKNARRDLLYNFDSNLSQPDSRLLASIKNLKTSEKGVDTAIVLSAKAVPYQQVITAIETLRKGGFQQVGLSSL